MLVANCGVDVTALSDKEKVHRKFGKPEKTGETDGAAWEEYVTRRKVANPTMGAYAGMGSAMTLFVLEPYFLVCEVYDAGKGTIVGRTLHIEYDAAGKVTAISDHRGRMDIHNVVGTQIGVEATPQIQPSADSGRALPVNNLTQLETPPNITLPIRVRGGVSP
ncbi:MAG: hypothetical protein U0744_01945 [Gemmataceae bacterium]